MYLKDKPALILALLSDSSQCMAVDSMSDQMKCITSYRKPLRQVVEQIKPF
jgi:hypothetical protein